MDSDSFSVFTAKAHPLEVKDQTFPLGKMENHELVKLAMAQWIIDSKEEFEKLTNFKTVCKKVLPYLQKLQPLWKDLDPDNFNIRASPRSKTYYNTIRNVLVSKNAHGILAPFIKQVNGAKHGRDIIVYF